MNKQTLSILFFTKKGRITSKGLSSIIMRITLNGVSTEISIKRKVNPKLWNQKLEKATGKDVISIEINKYIESLRARIYQIIRKFEDSKQSYNVLTIKRHLQGKDIEKPKLFFELFEENNERYRKRVGIDIKEVTYKRYCRTLRYFKEMYLPKYHKGDFPIEELNLNLIEEFEVFLKVEKGTKDNATKRHLKHVKKITTFALENNWIKSNPFNGKKLSEKDADVTFLTLKEIETIYKKEIEFERLERVRDAFIFCCYTGLAFVDVDNLKMEHIYLDDDGNKWIHNKRIKTGNDFNVPLLDIPLQLIKKYENHPCRKENNSVLPIICNQRMNAYLKEIATICNIKKRITTHIARHSFATSVTLANKVSIQNVAKMLGHTDLKNTQHYARVLNSSIMNEMQDLNMNLKNRAI